MTLKLLVIFAMCLAIGCQSKDNGRVISNNNQRAVRNVMAVTVDVADISEELFYTGRIEALDNINLTSNLSAPIKKINVREGDYVRKDDVLLVLEDTQLRVLRKNYQQQERTYQRMRKLYEDEALDKHSYEEISTAYNISRLNYENVFENTYLKSPVNGIVSNLPFKAGETFNPVVGKPLVRLINLNAVSVITYLSDRDVVSVEPGTKVLVKVDTHKEKIFNGEVVNISPEAEFGSGKFRCEIFLSKPAGVLRHNQFARITFLLNTQNDVLVVPQRAIIESNEVFVEVNNTAQKRNVTTGVGNKEYIEILSGLQKGERVIVDGITGLTPGSEVNIID